MNKKNKRKIEIVAKVGIIAIAFVGMVCVGMKIGKSTNDSSPEIQTYTYDYDFVDKAIRQADKNIKSKYKKVTESNEKEYLKDVENEFVELKKNKKIKDFERKTDLFIVHLKDGSSYFYQAIDHRTEQDTIVPETGE